MSFILRQPVHTFYGGAHLFRANTAVKLAHHALTHFDRYAPDPASLAAACGVPDALAEPVYTRVRAQLERQPIQDIRLDFEDGYGFRPATEEDGHARSAALEVTRACTAGLLPPSVGVRIKALTGPTRDRAQRTLQLFLTALAEAGVPPSQPFLVTLPKVTTADEVAEMAALLHTLEQHLGWPARSLGMELMIETPEALLDSDGRVPLRSWLIASDQRWVAAHFGAYDYTAACEVTAAHQSLSHPACRFARQLIQVSLAGTGVALVDGATTRLPMELHRGPALSAAQEEANQRTVVRAWAEHAQNVRQALVEGFYQGWDLHPAQLAPRYAAVYTFFLEAQEAATARLRAFLDKAAQATRLGDVFDDAASAQGLLNFFLRGLGCGALEPGDLRTTGLTPEELASRSFLQIIEKRRAQPPRT